MPQVSQTLCFTIFEHQGSSMSLPPPLFSDWSKTRGEQTQIRQKYPQQFCAFGATVENQEWGGQTHGTPMMFSTRKTLSLMRKISLMHFLKEKCDWMPHFYVWRCLTSPEAPNFGKSFSVVVFLAFLKRFNKLKPKRTAFFCVRGL